MQDLTDAESCGSRIRELRQGRGLSQQALASAAGVAIRTVVRIEQGEDARVGTLRQIASALDVPLEDLVATEPAAPDP